MSHEIRFNRGNRARTVYGRETIVVEQGGPSNCMVMCEDGRWYHPTKVWKIDADKDFASATDEELINPKGATAPKRTRRQLTASA